MHDLNRQDQTSERELEELRLQSKVSAVFNNTNSNVNTTNMSINVSISSHINNSIRLIDEEKKVDSAEKQERQEVLVDLQSELIKKDEESSQDKLQSIV